LTAAYLDDLAKMPLQASVFASWYNRHSKVLESRCFLQAFRLTHGCVLNDFSWYPKGIKFFVKKSRRLTLTRSKNCLSYGLTAFVAWEKALPNAKPCRTQSLAERKALPNAKPCRTQSLA
jgi:hypothetical protein